MQDSEEHLGRYINQLSREIRTAANLNLSRSGVDITGEQCRLIGYITHRTMAGEEVFQRDIEREFGIRRSSAASILSRIEKDGFIIRVGDSSDGRLKRIILTEKGRQLHLRLEQNIIRLEQTISEGMSEEEREEFMRLIKAAIRNLKNCGADGV